MTCRKIKILVTLFAPGTCTYLVIGDINIAQISLRFNGVIWGCQGVM